MKPTTRQQTRKVAITDRIAVGGGAPLLIIAGPCVIEDEAATVRLAERLAAICDGRQVPLVFKSSFDKANRTAHDAFRGPGLDEGLRILQRIKDEVGLPVLTDIHQPAQAGPAAQVADVLQVPAFLCRQTDLVVAAAQSGRAINLKKGQFVSPPQMSNVIAKAEAAGCERILVTERGACFGYDNLVVDYRSLPQLRSTGWPVVFDATHSVQLPGGLGTSSGGQRELVAPLARAAVAVGVDALFFEVHEDPPRARSDAASMITPAQLEALLPLLVRIHALVLGSPIAPS